METGPEDFGSVANFKNWITDTQNGVTFQLSQVRLAQITDGTTKTALIGEKYLNPERYEDGSNLADDKNIFVGHDRDNLGLLMLPNQRRFWGLETDYRTHMHH
jgi:hypothetical protein